MDTNTNTNTNTMLTLTELARFLNLSAATIRLWERQGVGIPAMKTIGGHRRYRLADVEEFLREHESARKRK